MRDEDGGRQTLYNHPVAKVLRRPNPHMSGINFRRAMIASLELHGNAYAIIRERDKRGYPTRIDFADATQMSVIVGNEDVYYVYGEGKDLIPSRDVIHFKGYAPDGIEGKSPIQLHRDMIENSINATRFSKNLYKNDLRSTAVFSLEGELSTEAYDRTKTQLQDMYRKASARADVPLVLEGGTKVNSLTITPEDAQFIATKLQNIDEIAAIFRVPPHKVGDWTRGTYSNNTQANLEYFTDCVRPLLEMIEEELSQKLFLEVEQDSHYIKFNFKGLLRTDINSQINNYRTMHNIGVLSPNEIREMEDLAPYEGGDRRFVPVNMAVNDKTMESNE
jgi:HK97 family phage portal protein